MSNVLKLILLVTIGFLFLIWNPIGLTGAWGALYFLTAGIFYWMWEDSDSILKSKGLSDVEIEYINSEKWKSFLRTAIQVVGALVAFTAIIGFNIPYLEPVQNALKELDAQWATIIESITTLIGVVITIIGFFKNSDRFESRSLIEPKRVKLK